MGIKPLVSNLLDLTLGNAEIQDEIATHFEEFADEYFTSNEVQDNLMNEYDIDNYVLTAPNNATEFEINMN